MRFSPEVVRSFASDLLCALGASAETAAFVSASLSNADLRGSGTHGVALLPLYAEMVAAHAIDPTASPAVESHSPCIVSVDGRHAFGQLTGREATAAGISTAGQCGAAVVGIRRGSHLGRLGEWAEQATMAGMIFLAFANTGGGARNVAPFGGHERKLSTNPVAFGVPTFDALAYDVIVDFATSQVSGAVIRECYRADVPLDDEWTTSRSGASLAVAQAFMDGEGALLPLGGRATGHKGYGLAVVAELLGGVVGGLVIGQQDPDWFSNAAMFIVVDPTSFLDVNELEERVTAVAEHLRDDQVRLPGEGAHHREITARQTGIELPDHVVASLRRLAIDLHVAPPAEFASAAMASSNSHTKLKSW